LKLYKVDIYRTDDLEHCYLPLSFDYMSPVMLNFTLSQIVAYFHVKSMLVNAIAVKVVNFSVEENGCPSYAGGFSLLSYLYLTLFR